DEAKYVVLDTGKPPMEPGPRDADIIWRYDMMDELGSFPHNASNRNILMLGDLLYVCTSNGQDWTHVNVPAPTCPSFIALNKKTGELAGEDDARIAYSVWSDVDASLFTAAGKDYGVRDGKSTKAPSAHPGIMHGQWSSPSAGKGGGKWQVFFGGGDGFLYAFDPTPVKLGETNLLRRVWSFDCN